MKKKIKAKPKKQVKLVKRKPKKAVKAVKAVQPPDIVVPPVPTPPPVKRPPWRPTLYKPGYCEEIIDFMQTGKSLVQFAAHLGVAKSTINEWASKNPDFSVAKSIALAKAEAVWENYGDSGVWNHKEGPVLNNSMWIFKMKARFGWRDQPKEEPSKVNVEQEQAMESKALGILDKIGVDT